MTAPLMPPQAQQPAPMGPPIPPPQPQADPRALKLLQMRPCDTDPAIARVRYEVLTDAMAGPEYDTFPPEWQLALVMAREDARHAAGIVTVAEDQAAKAQQAQMQAQQQQAQLGAKAHEGAANRAHQSAEADADRQHEGAESDRANALAMERTQMQTAARQSAQPQPAPGGM